MTSDDQPKLRIKGIRDLTESEKARMKEILAPGVAAARAKRLAAAEADNRRAA